MLTRPSPLQPAVGVPNTDGRVHLRVGEPAEAHRYLNANLQGEALGPPADSSGRNGSETGAPNVVDGLMMQRRMSNPATVP
jgi:hypothetical protein